MIRWDEVAWLDATEQAALVRAKQVQPSELVEAAIERIERLNPRLNAVVTPMYDGARAAAHAPASGPFTGVPFLLKDLLAAYAGVPMTLGARLFREFVPDHDSELVARLKRAGLVILGKTNTPELGLVPATEPALFGATCNPWDPRRIPGGSSGGSAAAVAAGMVPMAHGNDGGGSIRIPASCCGLFGLKPTRARNPLGPDFGDLMGGLVVEHALTRSVRDSATLLDATAGPAPGDPYWAPPPAGPFAREVGADPGRLRIAYSTRAPLDVPVHEDCAAAARDAAALCAELGHQVEEAAPPVRAERIVQAFTIVWAAGCAQTLEAAARQSGGRLKRRHMEPLTWALYEMGRRVRAPDYLLALQALQREARRIAGFFVDHDVWLTPTLAEPPLALGALQAGVKDLLSGFRRALAFVPFTPLANLSGGAAMSVPLYWNRDHLPVGVHFMADLGGEGTLFRLAAQLEAARPWSQRRPHVAA
jgi:amidase